MWCHRFSARLRVWRAVVSLWWWWQSHLFQLWLCTIRCRRGVCVFVSFLRGVFKLSPLGLDFTLPLAEEVLHVLRHSRRFVEIFFRFPFQKILHEGNEHRQRSMSAGHFIAERLLSSGVAHPHAGHISWRVTNKPNVGMIIDRSGLAGER